MSHAFYDWIMCGANYQVAVSSSVLQNLSLFAQYSAASYCTNNINSTGTKLTCSSGNCPLVEAANTKTLSEFYE